MKIGIIGLGLIGGSLGISIKQLKQSHQILGFDINPEHQSIALKKGLIDKISTKQEIAEQADMIFLAVNMDVLHEELIWFLNLNNKNQVIIDLGSVKSCLTSKVKQHKNRGAYLAAHPIAGTEFSGPKNAVDGLYKNKKIIFCDVNHTDPKKYLSVKNLFNKLCCICIEMSATEHDEHIAYVSHLAHALAFCLSSTVLEKEKIQDNILNMAGSGFASTVRLAKSSPEMWTPIFKHNNELILESIKNFKHEINTLENFIEKQEWERLNQYFKNSNRINKILD